jgi:hypothetical protein
MNQQANDEWLMGLAAQARVPEETMRDLIEACRLATSGIRDAEVMRRAFERMDRLREENRRRFGVQDIGVDIIREFRDRE